MAQVLYNTVRTEDSPQSCHPIPAIQITQPTEQEIYTLLSTYQNSFLIPQFESPSLYLGGCWFPAFITICVSLGVRCSAPPPGGTYTNEDTTSNEHPPPSVLNYSAVPLPEPTQHPEFAAKTQLKHKAPQTSSSPKSRNGRHMSVSAMLPLHVWRV